MSIELNHTIVWARDKAASAQFLANILGLAVGAPAGPFVPVQLANDVTLDYADATETQSQHYAFLVSGDEFDAALARVQSAGLDYWADPAHERLATIGQYRGERHFYFADPDGHNMELMTKS
jgi:catechol 2,3-dioxygenase-like lactoylglutathione lyase family enzyme